MAGPLLHIGYPKTGTTWLQRHLFPAADAGLAMPYTRREARRTIVAPHDLEFDPETCREAFAPGLAQAREQGLVPVVSTERLAGNMHFGAYDSAQLAGRLAAAFPDGRVLVVIREQRSMILSIYSQYVRSGGLLSIHRYLRNPGHTDPWPFDQGMFEYDRLLGRYQELFDSDRVLGLPYELFRRDPAEFVRRIVDFAGSDAPAEALGALPFDSVTNPPWPPSAIAAKVHLNRVLRERLTPWGRFQADKGTGRSMLRGLRTACSRLPASVNERAQERMRGEIAEWADGRYEDSNVRTAAQTGVDLGSLGYAVPSLVTAP